MLDMSKTPMIPAKLDVLSMISLVVLQYCVAELRGCAKSILPLKKWMVYRTQLQEMMEKSMVIRNVECRYPVFDYRPESSAKEGSRREMEV